MTIREYTLSTNPTQTVNMPHFHTILSVFVKNSFPTLVASVNDTKTDETITIKTRKDGQNLDYRTIREYLGSYELIGTYYHVFEQR